MSQYYNNVAYSLNQGPLTNIPSPTIVSKRAPTTHDLNFPIGQLWVESVDTTGTAQNKAWTLTSIINNQATWTSITGSSGGPGVFTTLTSTGTTNLGSGTGAVTIDSSGASSYTTSGSMTLTGGTGLVISSSTNNVDLFSATGNTSIDSGVITTINSGAQTTITSDTGGSVLISPTDAGNISIVGTTITSGSGVTNASVGSAKIGVITFTGFTTAALGTQAFTISGVGTIGAARIKTMFTANIVDTSSGGSTIAITGISSSNSFIGDITITCTNTGSGSWDAGNVIGISFIILG